MDSNQDMVVVSYGSVGDGINLPYRNQEESNASSSKNQSSGLNMFPSPLTCRNIDEMEYIDHGSQIVTPSQEDPDYEEIGNPIFEILQNADFEFLYYSV